MSLLGFGISMMFANFHVCGMMLFSDTLYMLARCLQIDMSVCVVCLTVLRNFLLHEFAISVDKVTALYLKVFVFLSYVFFV